MRWLLLTTFCALASAAADAAPRAVIVGVAAVDGDVTHLLAIDLDVAAPPRALSSLQHPAGDTPTGIVVDDLHLAAVLPAHGDLVLHHLKSGEAQILATGLMKNQRPQRVMTPGGVGLVAVRAAGEGAFDVVNIAPLNDSAGVEVIASLAADWLTPVPNSTTTTATTTTTTATFLAFKDGVSRVVALDLPAAVGLRDVVIVGTGGFRTGAQRADGSVVIEQQLDGADALRGTLLAVPAKSVGSASVVVTGLAGLSPVVAGTRAAASTGNKDGSIVVDSGDGRGFVRVAGGRVGIARPQAITSSGDVVVVVSVARGQQLPAELWLVTNKGARLLLAAAVGSVVTVYGITGAPR